MLGRIRIGAHDMRPERLSHRNGSDEEVWNCYPSAGIAFAKQEGIVACAPDEHHLEDVVWFPTISHDFHGCLIHYVYIEMKIVTYNFLRAGSLKRCGHWSRVIRNLNPDLVLAQECRPPESSPGERF